MVTTTDVRSADGRFNVLAAACPTRQVIDRVGDKWTLLVLAALGKRTLRFSQLRNEIEGISQKMLTQTLRGLERDGVVRRTVYPSVPPKVEYVLTPLGRSLTSVVDGIRLWAYAHMDDIEAARAGYDVTG
jgi:DNA-binding HxlR family transcriptional regulator